MITEKELKERCTPEFIKWMCNLAEGFEFIDNGISSNNWFTVKFNSITIGHCISNIYENTLAFSTFIHRAIEELNKKTCSFLRLIMPYEDGIAAGNGKTFYEFKNYQLHLLTSTECCYLNCLLDIYTGEIDV